jgi:hypothetical protein
MSPRPQGFVVHLFSIVSIHMPDHVAQIGLAALNFVLACYASFALLAISGGLFSLCRRLGRRVQVETLLSQLGWKPARRWQLARVIASLGAFSALALIPLAFASICIPGASDVAFSSLSLCVAGCFVVLGSVEHLLPEQRIQAAADRPCRADQTAHEHPWG